MDKLKVVHVSDFFWYVPSNKNRVFLFVPKGNYRILSDTRSIISKEFGERNAMQQLWDNREKLGLSITHKFQIQGNFNRELCTGIEYLKERTSRTPLKK